MGLKMELFYENAMTISNNEILVKTYFEIFNYMIQKDLSGACHPISTLLHILLNEQSIKSELCIGETAYPDGICFDHSWVTIDGKIYDIAVVGALPITSPPVFKDIDLETKNRTILIYGFKSDIKDNLGAKLAKETSFNDWMDGYPHHENGLWGVVDEIGKKIGFTSDIKLLKEKYKDTQRKIY